MQYLLTEEEYKRGCELIEGWKEENIPIDKVYDKSKQLNDQGFYTVLNCTDFDNELYEIKVFQRN